MVEFSFEKIINAKRESVFSIFSNYENYQNLFPIHFSSVRVRSVRNNIAVVEEHLNLGDKEFVIMAKHVLANPTKHEIFVIGGDIKGSHISQQFFEMDEQTRVIIKAKINQGTKLKLSNIFANEKLKEDYSQIIDDFVKVIEK